MGVLTRFKDIMSANINSLLDKAEDPAKMADQTLRNLNRDLENVRKETAEVMAYEKSSKRELDSCTEEIKKLQSYAEKAVLAGNDEDAAKFLQEKQRLVKKQEGLQQTYEAAAANSEKMRAMHDKLVKDIKDLEARRDALQAKVKVAKTQQDIHKMTAGADSASSSLAAFDRYEEKANAMLDAANATEELNSTRSKDEIEDLAAKYDSGSDSAVADELAQLKAKLGK